MVLGVSVSGYYDWLDRPESERSRKNRQLVVEIKSHHEKSRKIYGSPRIHRDLKDSGLQVGKNRVARLMRKHDIKSKVARKFVITTDSKNTMSPAPNRLNQHFHVSSPDKAWVCDTTFIETRKGWLYLAVVIDLYSRLVIGWSMRDRNNTELVQDSLMMALWRRGNVKSAIVHSDQGSTYASGIFQRILAENGLKCSMSRKGNCYDNAVAESFFGTLKSELVIHEDYRSHEEAKRSLFEYIEVFYNRQRRHSYTGYLSPAEYDARRAYI